MAAAQVLLGVMVLLCLVGQTTEDEFENWEWEELGSDEELHRLRGLHYRFNFQPREDQRGYDMKCSRSYEVQKDFKCRSNGFRWTMGESEHMMRTILSVLKGCQNVAVCVVQKKAVINMFLEEIEREKIHDALLTASEVSYNYRNKIILLMNEEEETRKKADKEYSEDPGCAIKASVTCLDSQSCPLAVDSGTLIKIIGSSSEDGNSLSGHSGSSLGYLMSKPAMQKAALFSIDGNTSNKFRSNFMRVLKSHDISAVLETTTQNHHVYQILDERDILATYKALKRPVDHSTQYSNQAILIMQDDPKVRKASTLLYDKHPAMTSVYILENGRPKLIKGDAEPISENGRLVLVGHGKRDSKGNMQLGGYKPEEVAEIIMYMNIEGNKIKTTSLAYEVGSDEAFYSTLLKELHSRSMDTDIYYYREFNYLGSIDNWPAFPDRFVSQGFRQDHTDDLEALAWAFFQHRKDEPSAHLTRPHSSYKDKYVIYDLQIEFDKDRRDYIRKNTRWISSDENIDDEKYISFIRDTLNTCYELKSGEDMLNVITHYARFGEKYPTYLMLNDWIFQIEPRYLYIFPVGKKLNSAESKDQIKHIIEKQFDKHAYTKIRENIKSCAGNNRYVQYGMYARKSLQGIYTRRSIDPEVEAWFSTYFVASLISESSRNFRSFPITLMAIDMSLSDNTETSTQGLEYLLDKLPMTKRSTWINTKMRGFHGSSTKGTSKEKHLQILIQEEEEIFAKWLLTHGKPDTDAEMLNNLLKLVYHGDQLIMEIGEMFKTSYDDFKSVISKSTSGSVGESLDGPITLHGMHLASDVESGEAHHVDAQEDVLKDEENVIGSIYSDILVSGYKPALLKGSDGDDVLVSLAEGDYLVGGEGRDIYVMVPLNGSITVDNCAEDKATDILYLPSMTRPPVVCTDSPSGLKLKFQSEDNTFLYVLLKDWLIDNDRCGHLTVIVGDNIVSDEMLKF